MSKKVWGGNLAVPEKDLPTNLLMSSWDIPPANLPLAGSCSG